MAWTPKTSLRKMRTMMKKTAMKTLTLPSFTRMHISSSSGAIMLIEENSNFKVIKASINIVVNSKNMNSFTKDIISNFGIQVFLTP